MTSRNYSYMNKAQTCTNTTPKESTKHSGTWWLNTGRLSQPIIQSDTLVQCGIHCRSVEQHHFKWNVKKPIHMTKQLIVTHHRCTVSCTYSERQGYVSSPEQVCASSTTMCVHNKHVGSEQACVSRVGIRIQGKHYGCLSGASLRVQRNVWKNPPDPKKPTGFFHLIPTWKNPKKPTKKPTCFLRVIIAK